MSGGSLNYACYKIDEIISEIHSRAGEDITEPAVAALVEKLRLMSKALRALEWWWSGDSSKEQALEDMRIIITPDDEVAALLPCAEKVRDALDVAIKRAKGDGK